MNSAKLCNKKGTRWKVFENFTCIIHSTATMYVGELTEMQIHSVRLYEMQHFDTMNGVHRDASSVATFLLV